MSADADKTEEATPRRLRKAREDGDSGASGYAAQCVAFVVAVALAPLSVRAFAARASDALRSVIAHATLPSSVAGAFDPAALAAEIVVPVLPLFLAVGLAGGIVHGLQTGGVIATGRLTPSLERLNPLTGARGLFSAARLFAVVRALTAAGLALWLGYAGLRSHAVDIAHVTGRAGLVGPVIAIVAGRLGWQVALAGLVLAVLDVIVVRRGWRRHLRMTKDEVKRERRDAEGDPQVKAARERAYQEMLAQATIANVRNATVVVVNPTHLACALRYDEPGGDDAPVVVANGEGELAARILGAARDHAVPVVHDVPLARALAELRVGESIPEVLYEAVAAILKEVAREPGS